MKNFILIFLFVTPFAIAHDDEGERASVGRGKGVESFDEETGFTLSGLALKRMQITTQLFTDVKRCDLNKAQIVFSLGKKMMYVKRDQKFKAVGVNCLALKIGDEVVTQGAEFLRVIEMDLTSGEEGGSHDE